MNALVRQQFEWEGPVPVNEAVLEERTRFIQTSLGEVKTELQELRAADKALGDRVDALRDRLVAENKEIRKEMTQGFEKVNARIDEKTDALSKGLGEMAREIAGLGKEMADMRGTVKATFLIASVASSAVTISGILIGIGKALNWF